MRRLLGLQARLVSDSGIVEEALWLDTRPAILIARNPDGHIYVHREDPRRRSAQGLPRWESLERLERLPARPGMMLVFLAEAVLRALHGSA